MEGTFQVEANVARQAPSLPEISRDPADLPAKEVDVYRPGM